MITKRLIQLLITLSLIIVLTAVGLILFVDPNRYKGLIVSHVEEKLQRPFAINGDISWRFWPRLGLSLEGVHLGQASAYKTYQNDTFAQIGQASIYVRIVPLLSKQIDVDKLSIQDATIYLLQQKGGNNWSDLQKNSQTPDNDAASSDNAFKVEISDISIDNTQIVWDNQEKQQKIDLMIKNLATSLQSNTTNPLDANLNVNIQPQNIQLDMKAQSDYQFNLQNKHYEMNNGKLTMTVQGLDGLNHAQEINLHFDSIARDFTQDTLNVDNLKAELFNGELYVNAKGETFSQTPSLTGKITASNLNPRLLAKALGQNLNTADDKVLQQLDLDVTFKNTADGFSAQPMTAQLDQTKLNGQFSFSKNNIQFKLNADQINIDHYLSNKTAPATKKTSTAKETSVVEKYRAQGDLSIGTLVVSGLTLSNTSAHIDVNKNVIKFAPLTTHLYSGSVETTTSIDLNKATPFWNIAAKLNNIDIGALAASDKAKKPKFTGRLNLDTAVTASGTDRASMLSTLNGKASINVDNGVLQGTDFGYWLAVGESMIISAKNLTTLAVTTAEAAMGKTNLHQTAFKDMSGTFTINKGIAHNEDLKVYNDSLYVTGKGDINLPAQTLHYLLHVGKTQNDSLQIPLTVDGSVNNPNVNIDPAAIQTLLIHGIGSSLITAAPLVAGPAGLAVGVGAAIVEGVADHNNTNNNSSNDPNATSQNNQNKPATPEDIVKDTLKGLLGQ